MLHSSELSPKFLLVDPRGSSVLEVGGFSEASSDSTGRPLEPALPALAHSPLSGVSLPFPPPPHLVNTARSIPDQVAVFWGGDTAESGPSGARPPSWWR